MFGAVFGSARTDAPTRPGRCGPNAARVRVRQRYHKLPKKLKEASGKFIFSFKKVPVSPSGRLNPKLPKFDRPRLADRKRPGGQDPNALPVPRPNFL